jgi:recombination protein RecA
MPPNRKILGLRDSIRKDFGENAAYLGSEMPPIKFITSGSLALDFAIGTGGVPRNRAIEIVGEEGSGKTTLALLMARQLLEDDRSRACLFLDLEHKITPEWVKKLIGPKCLEQMIFVAPDHAEEATNMYVQGLRSSQVSCSIYDSIGGAPTMAATTKDATTGEYGGNAQAISRWARLAAIHSAKYDCLTIGINQMREDMSGYSRILTPGGRAWRHAAIARIYLRRGQEKYTEKINGEDIQVGYDIQARVFKNQLAVPNRVAKYIFYNIPNKYGPLGVDTAEECVRLSTLVGVVDQRGGWMYHEAFPDGKVNGRGKLMDMIRDDEKLRKTIVGETLAALKSGKDLSKVAPIADEDSPDEDPKLSELMREQAEDDAEDAAAEEAEELAKVAEEEGVKL